MDGLEKLLAGAAIVVLLCALLLVLAWKYWHGHWLRSIAGNTMATDEELASPEQKRLGRRTAVVMAACAAAFLLLLAAQALHELAGFGGVDVAIAFTVIVVVGGCAWLCFVTWREKIAAQKKLAPEDPMHAQDAKIDRLAAIVLGVILAIYLVICLVVAPLAKA